MTDATNNTSTEVKTSTGWKAKGAIVAVVAVATAIVALSTASLSPTTEPGAALIPSHRQLPAQAGMQNDDIMVETLRKRLQQHNLTIPDDHKLPPHQFMHLHHMKTGGTSVDDLLKCSVKRMQHVLHYDTRHFSLHECTSKIFNKCLAGDEKCRARLDSTTFLSYCAPLKHLSTFGWTKGDDLPDFAAVTVLRHPVDRVWSNYRFATKGCYRCKPLKDIYKAYEEDTLAQYEMKKDSLCVRQMLNHETYSLLSSTKFDEAQDGIVDVTDDMRKEMVEEATNNMENFFTMVGITEELNTFGKMLPQVFPFMAPTIPGSHRACHLPHSNQSPSNNHCGPGRGHMELPPHPNNETRAIIEKHNQMDIELYEAAVERFKLQKKALGFR